MKVDLVSPEEILWEGEASFVAVPGEQGEIGILPGRQPVLATLKKGTVRITATGGEELRFDIESGFVSVDGDIEIVVDHSQF